MSMSAEIAVKPIESSERRDGLCILLVEDNEGDAYLICRTLAGIPGVGRVVLAQDGLEALAMVQRGEVAPDLAFIDLHMPRMNGFELLVAFSDQVPACFPMVVLTSSAAPNDAIRSRLRNATRVVTKPNTLSELTAALATTIDAVCPAGARLRRG
jgi:CheY-like chemotaxis protein